MVDTSKRKSDRPIKRSLPINHKRIMDRSRKYRYYGQDLDIFTFPTPTVHLIDELEDGRVKVQKENSSITFTCLRSQLVVLPTEEQIITRTIKRYWKYPFLMSKDIFEPIYTITIPGTTFIGDRHQIIQQIKSYSITGSYQQYLPLC